MGHGRTTDMNSSIRGSGHMLPCGWCWDWCWILWDMQMWICSQFIWTGPCFMLSIFSLVLVDKVTGTLMLRYAEPIRYQTWGLFTVRGGPLYVTPVSSLRLFLGWPQTPPSTPVAKLCWEERGEHQSPPPPSSRWPPTPPSKPCDELETKEVNSSPSPS